MKFEQEFFIKFKIKRIIAEDLFTVDILDTGDFKCEVKDSLLKGEFAKVYEGDIFTGTCKFVKGQKGDYFLVLIGFAYCELPSAKSELANFAASQIRGCSKETLNKVIDYLGNDFIGKINENPEILEPLKLKTKQKEGIIEWTNAHENLFAMIGDLYLKGVSPKEVVATYKKYGSKTLQMFDRAPYLIYLTGLVSFKKIDKMALKNGIATNSTDRIAAVIYNIIEEEENSGSMAISKDDLYKELVGEFSDDEVWQGLNFLIDNNFIESAEFHDTVYYGKVDNLLAERYIADYIKEVRNKKGYSVKQIEGGFKGSELNNEQRKAVYECLSRRFSILSGGPGTGKTFTIKRIIRTVKNINPQIKIALMAPTGKAASRMIEMIGMEALTIHASFNIAEGDDLMRKDGEILDKDLIIIDETSMMDEKLFSYVCRHIPKKTQVILVGDTGQLPSVDAGNLLSELSKTVFTYELMTICRQDKYSPIVLNAHNIRRKDFDKIEFDDETFKFIETDDIVETVRSLYKEYCKKYESKEIMVLSPQHNRAGTVQINNAIQEDNLNEVVKTYHRNIFKKGDRVIQLKNVRKLNIHNGDQGEVISASEKGLWVWFDEQEDVIEITDLDNIELAYAITVHKSQGSEANVILMVFDKGHTYTLSNKLVYTALTRAKNIFIGIGKKEVFYNSIKKESFYRCSLIKEYIALYDNLALETQEC